MMKKSLLTLAILAGFTTVQTEQEAIVNIDISTPKKSELKIKLYIYPNCPFCKKVKVFLQNKGIDKKIVFVNANNPQNYKKLKEISHKDICPYLHDEVHNVKMGESSRIMRYFEKLIQNNEI